MTNKKTAKFWPVLYVNEDQDSFEDPARQAPNANIGVYKFVGVAKGKTLQPIYQELVEKMVKASHKKMDRLEKRK